MQTEIISIGLGVVLMMIVLVDFLREKLKKLQFEFSNAENRFKLLSNYSNQDQDLVKVSFGSKVLIFINNPLMIQETLKLHLFATKWDVFYEFYDRDTDLTEIRRFQERVDHRKFFNFPFSFKKLKNIQQSFFERSESLCHDVDAKVGKGEFDLLECAKKTSHEIFCETTLGLNVEDCNEHEDYKAFVNACKM